MWLFRDSRATAVTLGYRGNLVPWFRQRMVLKASLVPKASPAKSDQREPEVPKDFKDRP